MKKFALSLMAVLFCIIAYPQGETSANGNDFMGGNLKIYVVLTVLVIILTFIFLFLFSMERRLNELERKQK